MPDFDLSSIDDFARAAGPLSASDMSLSVLRSVFVAAETESNRLYCVRCGRTSRMVLRALMWGGATVRRADGATHAAFGMDGGTRRGMPGLFSATCVQCKLVHDILVHKGPDGPEIAIFSPERGGFSTPHTPDRVRYYLDQAHRAESVGAASAAVSMYRSAAEMLLYEQGYDRGMLNEKITALLADETPPPWRAQIDADYFDIVKALGNAAIHPNDGDTSKQQVLDRSLLLDVRLVWEELLDVVYERPAAAAARKASLQAAANSFRASS